MLATIALIVLVLWIVGAFVIPIAGALVHLLLIVALVLMILHFVRGRTNA